MKTIAIVCSDFRQPWQTGRAIQVCDLVDGLFERGYQFSILALGNRGSVAYNERTPVHYIPAPADAPAVPPDSRAASSAQQALARTGTAIDVVHYHGEKMMAEMAIALSERLRVPLVTTVHVLSEHVQPRFGRTIAPETMHSQVEMCRRSTAVIAVSRRLKETIIQYQGVNRHAVSLIYNGVNPAWSYHVRPTTAELAELRASLGLQAERVILFAGRFEANKGVSALLRSAMHVTARYADVVYLMAGPRFKNDYAANYEALIANHPRLKSRIRLLGHQDRRQMRLLYHLAEMVVIPSISDGPAYVALEAMTAGTATIASDTGGLPEAIEHERSGLLVPLNALDGGVYDVNVPKLVEAQERVLNSTALAARLVAGARARIRERFCWDTMLQRTAAVYDEAVRVCRQPRSEPAKAE